MKKATWMFGAAALAAAAPLAAQEGSWSAWQGCWRPVSEDAPASQVVCVTPGDAPQAVRIVTLQDGAVTGETVLHADGVARPVNESGCTGTETASFSADRRRVYTRAELNCEGVRRTSSGVLAMVTELEWVDAQAVSVAGQHATRVMRYRTAETPASISAALPGDRAMAAGAARLNASAPLTIAEVAEASRMVAAPVVEALLAARQHGYDLNGARLVQLRDAGVPASTIDVMVALSYPEKFAVREPVRAPAADMERTRVGSAYAGECYDPFWTTRRYRDDCYDRRGSSIYGYDNYYDSYRSRSRYSPWGYDPYGWNYNTPIVVIGDPVDANENDGEVVKGRGYTRNTSSTGSATPRASSSGNGRSTAGASTTGRSSGTSSPSSRTPASSSSEPKDTGRTAKPRGGG